MNPEQENSTSSNPDPNNGPSSSYMQEMQQIVNPVDPNQPAQGQPLAPNNTPKLVKIADLVTNISLITWLVPAVGLLISAGALVLAFKTKKFSDKRARLRITLAIVGLVLSVICTGAIGYLLINKSSENTTNTTVNTYSETTTTEYLEGCAIVFDETTCNCMLEGLENNYTEQEYLVEEAQIHNDTPSNEYMMFIRNNQFSCEAAVTAEE